MALLSFKKVILVITVHWVLRTIASSSEVTIVHFSYFIFFMISSSCLNGGRCIDGINSYRCNCDVNYTGTNCEHHISPCDINECMSGATCRNTPSGGHYCQCPIGFEGPRCEVSSVIKLFNFSFFPLCFHFFIKIILPYLEIWHLFHIHFKSSNFRNIIWGD